MFDLATQSRLQTFRQKALAKTITQEEMIEAVNLLRAGRASAQIASTTAKTTRATTKKNAVLPDADDLLNEMME